MEEMSQTGKHNIHTKGTKRNKQGNKTKRDNKIHTKEHTGQTGTQKGNNEETTERAK